MTAAAEQGRVGAQPEPGRAAAAQPVSETLGYRLKRRLLGAPMINDQLRQERLSKTIALGVLSPDCISSSAYGTEQILLELLPYAALGAFTLVLPITGVILVILLLLTLSYREVVMVYTRAGGSYVVARENFGPKVAQIAAVALLIDYVVTVAVQAAAGTVAVASAIPAVGPYTVEITIGVVVLLAYGNLRGIREAGRAFAFPTYFFVLSLGAVIVVGVVKAATVGLPKIDAAHVRGAVDVSHGSGLVMGATILVLLRAFANGGSSLTGLEAISNGVSAFQRPEGPNARRALVIMASVLGFLVAGVSLLAYFTHAVPYKVGYPSVISQETKAVFGSGAAGHVLFGVVQVATALILYTGANTSFNGFPFLASFVAEDQFLPRQLRRRGHRLVFSNAIIVLTAISVLLLLATRAKVDALVPFYAIGVFTGFTMAGLGMARHHQRERSRHWRRKAAINLGAGVTSGLVVLIFAVAKFTEGAGYVVVLFPILVWVLIRLNREYREEAQTLRGLGIEEPHVGANYVRHVVLVFVDDVDLAAVEAIRYGRSLNPSDLRAVHFVLDDARARRLQDLWTRTTQRIPLELIDCPDRRLGRAALERVVGVASPTTEVSVLLPRRTYAPLLGRLLHDRTADQLSRTLSRVPHVVPTIVPYDAAGRPRHVTADGHAPAYEQPVATKARPPVAQAKTPPTTHADVDGRVRAVEVTSRAQTPVFTCEVVGADGPVTVMFYGRRAIPGITPGTYLRLSGRQTSDEGRTVMNNPRYDLLAPPDPDS